MSINIEELSMKMFDRLELDANPDTATVFHDLLPNEREAFCLALQEEVVDTLKESLLFEKDSREFLMSQMIQSASTIAGGLLAGPNPLSKEDVAEMSLEISASIVSGVSEILDVMGDDEELELLDTQDLTG